MSDPRNTQRRHEWMPNRMFDPATNPFAIQNLLKKEEKNDTFLLKRDERPVFDYADNTLLKEVNIQPAADFQFDELLDQPLTTSPAFQLESGDHSLQSPVSADVSDAVSDTLTISADQSESDDHSSQSPVSTDVSDVVSDTLTISADADVEISQEHELDLASSEDQLAISPSLDGSSIEDSAIEHREEALQIDAAEPVIDSPIEERLHEVSTEAEAQTQDQELSESLDASAQESVTEHAADHPTDQVIEATDNHAQTETEPEHPVEQFSEEAGISAGFSATEGESDTNLAQPEQEQSISTEPELHVAPGLDNEAVTQLIEAAREEARAEAHAAGFQEGLEAGLEQAKEELQASVDEKLADLDQIIQGLHQLERDPNALFEPMKKLSMHLAQQLVRGELTQSPQVIARLVDNCLRELAGSGEKAVIVHLNPEDLEQYKPLTAQFGDSIVLRPDALLSRGSVRASLDGSVVEDLIERRIKGLTKSLSQPMASSWRPTLGAASVKTSQSVATKPAVATIPVAPAEPADPVEALDHDEAEDNFSDDDDAISHDVSNDDVNDTNADRNDETHS